MSVADKLGEVGAYLMGGAVVGAIVGFNVHHWRESYLSHDHAGWELVERAPWCAVDQAAHTLHCQYFSKPHCDIGAILDGFRGPAGPLCVPKPK